MSEILHKIRAKLYPSYLPTVKGKYIARSTRAEAPLTEEQVCQSAKERGGYTGSLEDLIAHIRVYNHERTFLWSDGFATQDEYFSVHPTISESFDAPNEPVDRKKHRVELVHRERPALRKLLDNVSIFIEGVASTEAYIHEVLDMASGFINETLTPEGMFVITGQSIKIGGGPVACLCFTSSSGEETKINQNELAENSVSKLIGKIPNLAPDTYTLTVTTFYSRSSLVKEPRTIVLNVKFTVGAGSGS